MPKPDELTTFWSDADGPFQSYGCWMGIMSTVEELSMRKIVYGDELSSRNKKLGKTMIAKKEEKYQGFFFLEKIWYVWILMYGLNAIFT